MAFPYTTYRNGVSIHHADFREISQKTWAWCMEMAREQLLRNLSKISRELLACHFRTPLSLKSGLSLPKSSPAISILGTLEKISKEPYKRDVRDDLLQKRPTAKVWLTIFKVFSRSVHTRHSWKISQKPRQSRSLFLYTAPPFHTPHSRTIYAAPATDRNTRKSDFWWLSAKKPYN